MSIEQRDATEAELEVLTDEVMEEIVGGALLLPAVQKVRAAGIWVASGDVDGDGRD